MDHPQTNGLAKAANKIIIARLKKRLEQAKGLWPDNLHSMLWAYHTTSHSSTKETSDRLVYGSDTMIPIELAEPSVRIMTMIKESNEFVRRAELNLAEENRERARIHEVIKQQMVRKYNKKVNPQEFEGNLVLRKIEL